MVSNRDKDLNSDSIEVDDIQVPGIKIDKFGNKFTIPVGNAVGVMPDALAVPFKEPGFYYYFEKVQNVPSAISAGFMPVSRTEAGFKTVEGLPTEYGLDAGNVPHRIHDLVLMKAPQEVYDAIDKERQKVAKAATEPIMKRKRRPERAVEASGNVKEQEFVDLDVSPAGRFDPARDGELRDE